MSIPRRLYERFKQQWRSAPPTPMRSRKVLFESLADRLVLSASPYGAMVQDTGEYLLGSTAVTVV